MTRFSVIVIAGVGLGFGLPMASFADTGSAPANYSPAYDTLINFADFQLGPDDGPTESTTFSLSIVGGSSPIVGFSFSGLFAEPIGHDEGWASDMRLDITSPTGALFSIGGFGAERADNDWEFQGSASADAGLYQSTHWMSDSGALIFSPSESITGEWTFTFANTFGTQNEQDWSNASLTFHSVPAPTSGGLLAVAGLYGIGRRRRR